MDKEPLLESGGQWNVSEKVVPIVTENKKKGRCIYWACYALVVTYVPLLVALISLYLTQNQCDCPRSSVFPSLARSSALQYEQRTIPVHVKGNPFAGFPRPELDAAWHGLFEDVNFRVSGEDLKHNNLTSILLADGSGFVGELGVHHELHCLKKIRHWMYREYYLADETESELVHYELHVHHCLELLREVIICRGDTTLSTFEWVPGSEPPAPTVVAHGHHQCVKWDSLMSWVRRRSVDAFEPGVLLNAETS